MPKLTKRIVDSLRTTQAGKDLFYWDAGNGALKGFGVRLKPSGAGAFIIQYRNVEGRTRRMVLGKIGTLTVEEARAAARDRLTAASKGADPSAERKAVRGAMTVAELCDNYLKSAGGRVKPSTLAMDRSRIETHVKPLIGRLSVRSLTAADVERMKTQIIAGKTAMPRAKTGRGGKATGGPGVAGRTVGMLATILQYAINPLRLIEENPARGIKKPADGKQRRFLSIDEIGRLGAVMRGNNAIDESPVAIAAIRLLLLTGLRRMEALALPKAWVDLQAHCIRFGDTKSGAQLRVIGASAVRLLQSLTAQPDSLWVFPGERNESHFVGLPKMLRRLSAKAELTGVTVHVLRHTFAATAAGMGYSELTIAGLLGHSVPGATARYAHVPDAALASAADRISATIAAALDGLKETANAGHSLLEA
jgi:site-specific recombinase XerD